MSKESLQSIQKRAIFRETFSDEATTRALNGVPTAVTYQNGTAVCVAANSSKIVYQKALNGVYSIRIRLNNLVPITNAFITDFRNTSGNGTGYIQVTVTQRIAPSSGTCYIDGVASDNISSGVNEISITGITISSIETFFNSRYSSASFETANYDLFEIYEGTLTAQEVSNLYNNKRYKSLPPYRSGISEILNVDGKNGTITNKYSGDVTGNELITNGDFSSATGWTVTGETTISGGVGRLLSTAGASSTLQQSGILTVGKTYRVSFDIIGTPSGSWSIGEIEKLFNPTTSGKQAFTITALTTNFTFKRQAACDVTLDNVSVKEIIPTIVNTAVTSVRSDGINVMDFNGSTSKLDCGSYDTLVGDKTFIFWSKRRTRGGAKEGRWLDNGRCFLRDTSGENNFYVFTRDGVTIATSASQSLVLGKFQQVIITSTSTGITNFYINGVINSTTNKSAGTPVAGTTNLYIGNNSSNDRGFDGNISGARIINGILSTDEISQLWSSERVKYNV